MFKERVKTSIIIILFLNCIFMTYKLWFGSGILDSSSADFSLSNIPFVRLISSKNHVSVPKENLSKPRKIVINDGSLWVPYYNTDTAFDLLDEKTSTIIKACLRGEGTVREITYDEWLESLSEQSIYVEYPVSVTPSLLASILGEKNEKFHASAEKIKDVIIIPRGESSVEVAIRDEDGKGASLIVIDDEKYALPSDVIAMYADRNRRDGYYEFAFSTLLGEGSLGESTVSIDDLVLFSDNYSSIHNISASDPLLKGNYSPVLKSFSFNAQPLRHYKDDNGCENYVENYATVKIHPDGYIEYSAVVPEKGIEITQSNKNEYELLNSAIDFAEKVWQSVSDESLNVLLSGIEKTDTGTKFTFDYYYLGREVAIRYELDGEEPLYHAIEIETRDGRIVSYRQYMRRYEETESSSPQESFVAALDYFVDLLSGSDNVKITDLYPGYYDGGGNHVLKTTWLARVDYSEERIPMR
jgi:hypothetical protein